MSRNPTHPERRETSFSEILFTDMVNQIGAQAVQQLFDRSKDGQAKDMGAVMFPTEEYQFGIALRGDGLVHVQYDRTDQFTLPLDRAQQITEELAQRQRLNGAPA